MSDDILSIGLDPAPLQDGVQKAITALETIKKALSEFANTPADRMKAELEKVTREATKAAAEISGAAKELQLSMVQGATKGAQAMAQALKVEGDKAVGVVRAQRQQIQAEYEALVSKGWKIKPPKLMEYQQKGVQLAPDDRVALLAYKDSFAAASAAYKVRIAESGKAAAAERSFLNTIERDTQSTYNAIYRFKVAEAKKADREEQALLSAVQRDTQSTWNRIYQYKVSEAKKADREEKAFSSAIQRDTQATYNAIYRFKVAEAKKADREEQALLGAVQRDTQATWNRIYQYKVSEAKKADREERSFLNAVQRDTQSTYNAIYRFKVAEAKKADREEQAFLGAVQRDTQATWNRIYQYKVSEAKKADREERSFLNAVQRDTQSTYNAMYRYKVAEATRAEREIAANQAKNASFQAMTPQGQLARATRVNYAVAGGMGEAEAIRRYGDASVTASKHLALLQAAAQNAARETATLRNASRTARESLNETGSSAAGATKPLRDMAVSMNDLHSAARGVASGFNAMWLTWGNIAPLLAGAALSNAFVQSIKKGSEFMHTLTQIEVLAGESAESVGQLSDKALELGARGPFGPLQVADALKTLALAGLNAKEQIEAIGTVRNFAMVGDMDLNTASERLVAIGTAYGYAAKDFSVVSDVIAKTAAASMASIDGMSESFKQASVVAQQYGVTLEDTSTTLALLSQIGIVGQSAGTAMRNMYTELMGSSKRARAVLEQTLKIDVWDNAAKAMKPLPVIMDDMLKALSRYDSKSQQAILSTLGNERGTKALAANLGALMNKFNETGDAASNQFTRVREEIANSAGFTAQAAAVMATTSVNQMKAVGSTLETTLIKAFKEAEPAVQALALKLREIFGSAEFQNAVTTLAGATASFTESLVRNAETIATLVKLYLTYKASMAAAQLATLALGTATTVVAAAQRAWAATTMVVQGLVAAIRGSASASMVLTSSLMAATGATTAAAGAMGLLQASLGPIAAILAAAGAAWYFFGAESEKASSTGGRSIDTLNASMDTLMESMDEEIKRLKAVQEQREQGLTGAVAAASVEKVLAADKIKQIAEHKRQLLDLQKEELKTAYASWEKYKGIPLLGTIAEDAQTGIFSKLKDLESSYRDVAASESAGLARVAELHTLAVANAKAAAQEIADSLRKRPAGPGTFDPDEVGANQASKLKVQRDNEIKELEKQYGLKLSVIQSSLTTEKQLLDKARSAEAIGQGEFAAKELALVESSERKQLEAIESNSAAVFDAYRRRREELQGLLTSANGTKGGAAKVKEFSQELENLDNSLASFTEKVKGDKAKLEDSLMARLKTQAIEAQGALRKLNEDAKEFARAEERLMEDRALDRELAARLRGASEDQAAVLKAQFDEQKRLNEQVRGYTESIRKAEDALAEFWETSKALAEADPNWAGYTYEQMVAVKAMEDRIARLKAIREQFSADATGKVAQEGVNALGEHIKDKQAELSKSFAGALETALVEGASKGRKKLRDIVVAELRKPITLYIQAAVQTVMGSVANLIGLGGGAGSAGGSGSAMGAVNSASSLYNLYNAGSSALTVASQVAAGTMSAANAAGTVYANAVGGGIDALLATNAAYGTTGAAAAGSAAGTTAAAGSSLGASMAAAAPYVLAAYVAIKGLGLDKRWAGDPDAYLVQSAAGQSQPYTKSANTAFGQIGFANGDANILKNGQWTREFGETENVSSKAMQSAVEAFAALDSAIAATLNEGEIAKVAEELNGWYRKSWSFEGQMLGEWMVERYRAVFNSIDGELGDAFANLKIDGEQLAGAVELFTVLQAGAKDIEGMTQEVQRFIDGTSEHTRKGETAAQTVQRLAGNLEGVNTSFEALGLTLYENSLGGAKQAQRLVDAFGGADAFNAASSSYYQNFYTESERVAFSIKRVSETLGDLGLEMPTTLQEFRALVDAADAAGDQSLVASLVKLSPAFEAVSTATKQLSKDLLDYVSDLKGNRSGLATPTQQLATARQAYMKDLIAAQGGDQDALGRVTSSAQSYIDAQKVVTASGVDTQMVIDQVIQDLTGVTSSMPKFASGGYHEGGWAMVGEEGPELAYFGSQARIYTAQQSTSMLSNDAVVAELRALREEVTQLRAQQTEETRAVINSNAAVQGRAAEAIVNGVAAAGERQAWNQSTQPVIN